MTVIKRFWPAILWALAVLILTGLPGSYIPRVSSFWEWISLDKLVHVFIFAAFSLFIFYGFREQYLKSKMRYLYILAVLSVTVAYGLITEVMQRWVFIGRDGNIYDFIADFAGGLIGCVAFYLYINKKKRVL